MFGFGGGSCAERSDAPGIGFGVGSVTLFVCGAGCGDCGRNAYPISPSPTSAAPAYSAVLNRPVLGLS